MEDFIGVNLRRQDPVDYLDCAGFVREYHSWSVDEGDVFDNIPPSLNASSNYPDNIYMFENGYQNKTYENFPVFYSAIESNLDNSSGSSLPIVAAMNGCLPRIAGGKASHFNDFKPVWNNNSISGDDNPGNVNPYIYCPEVATNSPYAYTHYADWVYNFTLAFKGVRSFY